MQHPDHSGLTVYGGMFRRPYKQPKNKEYAASSVCMCKNMISEVRGRYKPRDSDPVFLID